jgi:NADP-dependent 3-hydroxy acid dehydrogenase YdfG
MATMTDFSGHTVLVTGAAAGIGFGIGGRSTPPAAASRSAT